MDPSSQAPSMEPVALSRKQLLLVLALFPVAFVLFGFIVDSPAEIFRGLLAILTSRDTLITDYIGVGGMGAAFVNAGLLTLLADDVAHDPNQGARENGREAFAAHLAQAGKHFI